MIPVVFGFVLLVLVIATIVLFAMMAELPSRVPARPPADRWARPDEQVQLGVSPATWPRGVERQRDSDRGIVLVLSPLCESCALVASQLATDDGQWRDVTLLISALDEQRGLAFLNEYQLNRFSWHVDEGGQWVSQNLGVNASPTALVFGQGSLREAYSFNDLPALRAELEKAGSSDKLLARKEVV